MIIELWSIWEVICCQITWKASRKWEPFDYYLPPTWVLKYLQKLQGCYISIHLSLYEYMYRSIWWCLISSTRFPQNCSKKNFERKCIKLRAANNEQTHNSLNNTHGIDAGAQASLIFISMKKWSVCTTHRLWRCTLHFSTKYVHN